MNSSDEPKQPAAKHPSAMAKPRVLVIDDEEQVRLKAGRTLLRESMDIREASSVQSAIEAIETWQPDAIIVDLLFEHGSGYEIIKAYRRTTTGRHGVVIVVSVLDDFETKLESMRVGSDAYFCKPIDWDALSRKLVSQMRLRDETQAHRVLLVEDEIIDAVRTRTMLGANGYQVLICRDPADFEADLDGFQPDLILMDISLPGASGFELARWARQHERHAATPIIFLTADASEASQLESITSGGDDHIVKPAREQMLLKSIKSRIHRSLAVKTLMERDGLTGLLTHAVVMSRIAEFVQEKQRNPQRDFSLVLLDLDHFKDVNDRFGHVVGDKVLASLSAYLRAQLRGTDIIGRYGGEEFVVVLPDTSPDQASELIERLLASFSTMSHGAEGTTTFHVTFSAGIAGLEAGWSVEEWKVLTDEALYEAKDQGRNRVIVAGQSPRAIERTTGVLDATVVASLRELGRRSNTDLLSEVAELFLRIAPERLETLDRVIMTEDLRAIEMTAHAFRSAAANLGATALAGQCAEIENLAREKNLGPIEELLPALRSELDRVTSSLRGLNTSGSR